MRYVLGMRAFNNVATKIDDFAVDRLNSTLLHKLCKCNVHSQCILHHNGTVARKIILLLLSSRCSFSLQFCGIYAILIYRCISFRSCVWILFYFSHYIVH